MSPPLHPDQFYGKGMEALFPEGSSPKTTAPFPMAGRLKHRQEYDPALVTKALNAPPQPKSFDPRTLHSTQPSVTRAGVAHYMSGGDYERKGETFADPEKAGNKYPMIYSRKPCEDCPETHLILAGHHRATAALLEGRQLEGLHVEGGWGPAR